MFNNSGQSDERFVGMLSPDNKNQSQDCKEDMIVIFDDVSYVRFHTCNYSNKLKAMERD